MMLLKKRTNGEETGEVLQIQYQKLAQEALLVIFNNEVT